MPKGRNRGWYTKKLAHKCKLVVKLRDDYTCQKCKKPLHDNPHSCHASHVLNVGAYKQLEIDPHNLKVLCSWCHIYWWHKNPLESGAWFKETFPDRYYYLMEASKLKWRLETYQLAELHNNTKSDGTDYPYKYYELIKEYLNA